MQDRYVADVGDFGKYGLLRALAGLGQAGTTLKLAVLWYLVPNETGTNDGRHVAYLSTAPTDLYGRCDPKLFESLRQVLADGRNVAAVQRAGILPSSTLFHSVPLSYAASARLTQRREQRRQWFAEALAIVHRADVVFLDPDNGLECRIQQLSKKGPKYTYYEDVKALSGIEKSLVIYHHLSRQGTASEQVLRRARELRGVLPVAYELFPLRFRRGSARVFFVAAAPSHCQLLRERVNAFASSEWRHHFVQDPLASEVVGAG